MCSPGSAKAILITFNIIFLLFGGVCMGIGIWVKVDQSSFFTLTRLATSNTQASEVDVPSLIESAAYMLIAGGAAVFIIAFLGFCGALKQVKCCLYLYATFVLLILLIQISAAILAVVFKTTFDTYATLYLNVALTNNYVGPYSTSDSISLAFDAAQVNLKCCGINNGSDYSTFSTWNTTWTQPSTNIVGTANIPFTCCISSSSQSYPTNMTSFYNGLQDDNCPVSENSSHQTGCYDAVWTLLQAYLYVTAAIGIGVGLFELMGVISACYLALNSDENKIHNLS